MKRKLGRWFSVWLLVVSFSVEQASATLITYFDFEPPDTSADGMATDMSGNGNNGTFSVASLGGSYSYVTNTPAALGASTQSARMNQSGDTAARLGVNLPVSTLDLNNQNWSYATWFNLGAGTGPTNFVLHLGDGDGFGGGNETYVNVTSSGDVVLQHFFDGSNQINFGAGGGSVTAGSWHHLALTHNAGAGVMTMYLDGTVVGSDNAFGMNLPQSNPIYFGGHDNAGFQPNRWFGGDIDDAALFSKALDASEVTGLANGTLSPTQIVPEPTTTIGLFGLIAAALFGRGRRRLLHH